MTETDRPELPEALLMVRAAVNLNGLRAGATALVDPKQPYIADCLKAGLIVPTDGE